ncbi:MAG: molybdenum cofactor biosynthesis protein MoaE [Rhodothalassiaceae bacterium]
MAEVRIEAEPFDIGAELKALMRGRSDIGACVAFTGLVRDTRSEGSPLLALHIEHYPALTRKRLEEVAAEAERRFSLKACLVIHRHGTLAPNEEIVLVATAAPHRRDAFEAAAFLMDRLKTDAPFWKREDREDGQHWVAARAEDETAAARWNAPHQAEKE